MTIHPVFAASTIEIPFSVIQALPPILGFAAIIVYIIWTKNRPPSGILVEILALVKQRGTSLPPLDKRLTARQVSKLLAGDVIPRSSISENEFRIIEGVRKSEHRERLVAQMLVAIIVIFCAAAFVYLLINRPKASIGAINFSGELAFKATAENSDAFVKHLRPVVEKILAKEGAERTQALIDNGMGIRTLEEQPKIDDVIALCYPSSPHRPGKLGLGYDQKITILDAMSITVRFYREPPKETAESLNRTSADFTIGAMFTNEQNWNYIMVGADFRRNLIVEQFVDARPDVVKIAPRISFWEDLVGYTVYISCKVPYEIDAVALSVGDDAKPQFVLEPKDFVRIAVIEDGYEKPYFKAKLSEEMRNRAILTRVVDKMRL